MAINPEARFTWTDAYNEECEVWADLVLGFDEYSDARTIVQPQIGHERDISPKYPIITHRPAGAPMGTLTVMFVQDYNGMTAAKRAAYLRQAFATGNSVAIRWGGTFDPYDDAPNWTSGTQFVMTGQCRLSSQRVGTRHVWQLTVNYTRVGFA